MILRCMILIFVAGAVPTISAAQQRDTPGAAVLAAATASVSGHVVLDDANATPARRAIVTLISRVNGATFSEVTDNAGSFAFAALPAGRYDLMTSKASFVSMTYGARQPGRPGTPIVLAEGQALSGLRAVLMRGAVLTGVVRLANGSPLKDTPIVATRTNDGSAVLSGETDDRGVFRLFGLPPGEYLVSAVPQTGTGETVRSTTAGTDALFEALRKPRVRAGEVAPPAPPRTTTQASYAPTYHPGVTHLASATRVTLAPGMIRDDLDFTVDIVRTATLSGIVTGVSGQPATDASLSLVPAGIPGSSGLAARFSAGRRPDAQGRFTIPGIPPGQYILEATSGQQGFSPPGTAAAGTSPREMAWGSVPVSLSGDDQAVNLMLQPTVMIEGRVVLTGATKPPSDLSAVRIALDAAPGSRLARGVTRPDGTFRVEGVVPDTYSWTVTLPPAISRQWSIQSITANGRELRDTPMAVRADAPLGPVQVVLSDTATRLDGTLDVPSGQTPAAYDVVLFAADRALWHAASPRLRLTRPGTDGSFSARDLLPGTYRLAAITASDDDEWKTPAFLESLMEASIPVTIAAGQVTRQDVRIR